MRCKERGALALVFAAMLGFGCGNAQGDRASEAPPPAPVEREQDTNVIQVDHPAQFPLSTAVAHKARSVLVVTGVVTPDVARNVPVITLASGRVVAIHARLGDRVQKGQLLLTVRSDDVSAGYSDYRNAVADEALAHAQLDRAKDLLAVEEAMQKVNARIQLPRGYHIARGGEYESHRRAQARLLIIVPLRSW